MKGSLLSVDFDEPEDGKMVLHVLTNCAGVCAGEVYVSFASHDNAFKALLQEVLDDDEANAGFSANYLDKDLKRRIEEALR